MPMSTAVNKEKNTGKIWTRDFINIFILNFVMSMGQFMMNTLIPKYAHKLGAAASVVGIVTGIFAVSALAMRPVAGPAMDYFKKNRLLSAAIAVITVSFVLYGLSGSIPMLIAARLFHGIAMSVSAPLSLALVSNILPVDKIASGLGFFSLGSAVSTAIGPTIGLTLADTIGYKSTFFICAFLLLLSFILSLQLKSEPVDRTQPFKVSLDKIIAPEVLLATLITFFIAFSYSGINSFLAIYGELSGVKEIGLFFTASAVCMIFIRPVSGKIADKYGHDKSVLPGIVILIAAFVLISFCRTLPMFIFAGIITAFGFGSSQPILETMTMQLVPVSRRGAAGNTNFTGIDCAFLLGPPAAGFIITTAQESGMSEIMGYSTMYRLIIIPMLIAIALFWVFRKKLLSRIKAQREAARTDG